MTQTWAIVAIPEETDAVHKVSSEKVAHMTLLFLGEQSDPDKALQITQYLQHVTSTSLNKFYLRVDHRGELGPDKADVLFFDKKVRHIKPISDFRSFLLQDPTISECYNSTDQYPEWTPHLTLGYPATPAKKPQGLASMPIYSVYFDRIALWVEDSDGPSFQLEDYDYSYLDESVPAYHSATRGDLFLRNALARQERLGGGAAMSVGPRAADYTNPVATAVIHALPDAALYAQRLSNQDQVIHHAAIGELQRGSNSDSRKAYIRENQAALESYLEHRLEGSSKSGALSRIAVVSCSNDDWLVTRVDSLAHTGTVELKVRPITDAEGMIEDYELLHDALTDVDIRTALMHVGVKGMKWGVRRNLPDRAAISSAASAAKGKAGTAGAAAGSAAKGAASSAKSKFEASREARRTAKENKPKGDGGYGTDSASKKTKEEKKLDKKAARQFDRKGLGLKKPKPSEEAEINAQARKRTEKHGTDLMSNKELQAMVTRMNLEQQYQNLQDAGKAKTARARGASFAKDILKQAGAELANEAVKYAATEAAKGAFGQARNSDSATRTWVNSTSSRVRRSSPQIGPGLSEILQLPRGRS